MNEKAEDAVLREVYEETGVRFEIDRLAVIHENFWKGKGAFDQGLNCHEIAFYFLMKPRGTKKLKGAGCTRFDVPETLYWIPIEKLPEYKHFPSFLYEYLKEMPDTVVHIVSDER